MSFDDLLKADHIEPPKNTPEGHWKSEVQGLSLKDPRNEDANYNKRAIITLKPVEPDDDVDAEEAETFMNSDDFEDALLFYNVFLAGKRDVWKLKNILNRMGFEGSIEDATESGSIEGYTATAYVEHELDDDGEPRVNTTGLFVEED